MQVVAKKVSDGFGFGLGTISATTAGDDVRSKVAGIIASPAIVVPIDHGDDGSRLADDGCGDGRPTTKIMRGTQTYKRSLNRAKVFGGGATMTAAMLVGLGKDGGAPLTAVFEAAAQSMQRHGLDFGAHTDDHAHSPACGCGAIDKAPQIIAAIETFRQPIADAIAMFGFQTDALSVILDRFAVYGQQHEADAYVGSDVMAKILAQGKVVKQLAGAHQEIAVILNTIEDWTVDQAAVRAATANLAQVFAVDVWRLAALAKQFNGLAADALQCELAYTLATAAVLTKGDLPVYMLSAV